MPPLQRFDLDEVLRLIRAKRYFVLHAPRQTGKTTALLALRDLLNEAGGHRCVYANVETAQTARGDVGAGIQAVLAEISERALVTLGDGFLDETWKQTLDRAGPHSALRQALGRWSSDDPKPLVLLIDEIDAMVGDALISVLRQLRGGYDMRPTAFPQSVVLCGVRDVRDYRIHSESAGEIVTGGSAFNIKAESLRLGDLEKDDVRSLLGQHTVETGQAFTDAALAAVWNQSQGQPWLVNALAYQACFRNKANRDRSRTIDEEAVMDAREELVLGRQTHLHQLADKLREERVRRVVEPVLSGDSGGADEASPDDVEYVRDLGLLARHGIRRIANPIYQEVIPRELMYAREDEIPEQTEWYVKPDGDLDVAGLLTAFQRFFREHSEHWIELLPVQGGGPAAAAAGVPAAGCERRRPDRAGVRAGPAAHRSPDRVAAWTFRRDLRARDAGPPLRGGVQDPPRRPRRRDPRGDRADAGVHGPVPGRIGPPGDLRPGRVDAVGGKDLPPRGVPRRWGGDRVGGVSDGTSCRPAQTQPAQQRPICLPGATCRYVTATSTGWSDVSMPSTWAFLRICIAARAALRGRCRLPALGWICSRPPSSISTTS